MGRDASPPRYLSGPRRTPAETPRSRGVNAREAGLAFAGRANRWMISGAVVLAAGVSAVTAHAFHAKTAAAARLVSPVTTTAVAPSSNDDGGAGSGSGAGLQSPSAPPAPAPAGPASVSGGS